MSTWGLLKQLAMMAAAVASAIAASVWLLDGNIPAALGAAGFTLGLAANGRLELHEHDHP